MSSVITNILGDGGISSLIFLMIFFFLYPRLMLWQIMWKLEAAVRELEAYVDKAEETVVTAISPKPDKKLKNSVRKFMEFFVIPPVNIDPYGIMVKLEHIKDESEHRFRYFVEQIAPKKSKEEKANLVMGLAGALGTNQIFKIIRHNVVLIKKTNNFQIAMIIQMYLPLLMELAKAQLKATKAFVNGVPIGDAIGPMVAASFMKNAGKTVATDVVMGREKIHGKDIYIIKAQGPGARLGKLGDAVEKISKKHKIQHIITIDAAAKLEGEKTGRLAEGVGVAMGGIGVDRAKIEECAVKRKIPMDAIAVKQSAVEASIPMKKEIYDAMPLAKERVENLIKNSKKKRFLLIGVGNTCGAGNNKKSLEKVKPLLKPAWKRYKEAGKKKKKGKW